MASEDDNYGSLSVKGTPVAELKINDIKKELDKRGLSKSGSKTQMLERLKAQLLLEKLQQDAAQSSGDELEGKVPNMALQQESAGQSEFVRQYLEQQQRNLEKQMEVKKQVEEERKRKSADESSADETATPQESSKPKVDPEVTSPKKFKDDSSNAPASDESKMPRPARKSNRNASKGENGQDAGIIKEKSRSPSPEKESLRERTRSGSSSSSRSATPEAATRRGRSTRGVRGGRRGGRRGRGRPGVSRKESRSSSHSSTEEEVMPKKRSRRSTNSRSSRSRSRSPSQKTSPEVTPATRRSSRRISATKTPPDHDLPTEEPIESSGREEDPAVEKPAVDDNKAQLETVEDAKASGGKEGRRSVEVLEPAAGTIKTIEIADMVSEENSELGKKHLNQEDLSQASESSHKSTVNEVDIKDVNDANIPGKVEEASMSEAAEPSPDKTKGLSSGTEKVTEPDDHRVAKSNKEGSKLDQKHSDTRSTISSEKPLKGNVEEKSSAMEQEPKQSKEDKNRESSKRGRQRSDSSSGSSSSTSPPTKRETKRSRSDSSSSTDLSQSHQEGIEKPQVERTNATTESKSASGTLDLSSQPEDVKEQTKLTAEVTVNLKAHGHREEEVGDQALQKSKGNESQGQSNSSTANEMATVCGDDKQLEVNSQQKEPKEKTSENSYQTQKSFEDETISKKDKTAKKRKWGSKNSKTGPASTKKPTSMEISSDSLKNLIGEVKLSETVFDMETEVVNTLDYDEHEEDRRDVKVKRTVVENSPPVPDDTEMAEDGHDEDARKVEASGDAPNENVEEQKTDKTLEEVEQIADETEAQSAEPKKKVAKSSPSAGSVAKDSGKKKVIKEGKKVKKKKGPAGDTVEGKENKTVAKDKGAKEPSKIVATTRPSKPILPVVDEPEKVPGHGDMSPARHPPDRVLRIAGLVRPFTLGQLKELLKRTGELDEEHFWINDIKSHCLAAFKTEEDAVKTRVALHGTRWPQSNPKILIVDFATIEDVVHRKAGGVGAPPTLMNKNHQEQRNEGESREVPNKEPQQKDKEDRERAYSRDTRPGEKRKEGDKPVRERERLPPQIREWDKDKMKQPSRSRSKSKERDRPTRRSRSRERDQRKRRDGSREKREDDKKKEKRQKEPKSEEEPPAKLLDDLFRKTKATPCIYWLPLTEEQAQQRAIQREELEKEKQKRLAAAEEKEKEELKKREAARLERQKQREKERERSREKERSAIRDRDRSRERARGGRVERGRSRSRSASGNRSRRRR